MKGVLAGHSVVMVTYSVTLYIICRDFIETGARTIFFTKGTREGGQ